MTPTPESSDLYKILQVDPEAGPEVIEAAYLLLEEIYHPDRNPAADVRERRMAITRAYRVLSDPQRRGAYDRQRVGASIGDIVPDVISAKSFRLVNDTGQTRAELSLDQSGEPHLVMNDQDGNRWFDMYHDENGSRLILGDVSLVLGAWQDGEPHLVMFYRGTELRLELDDLHSHLEFTSMYRHDGRGSVRLAVVEKDDGTRTLEIIEDVPNRLTP